MNDQTFVTNSGASNFKRTFVADEGLERIIFNHMVVDKSQKRS